MWVTMLNMSDPFRDEEPVLIMNRPLHYGPVASICLLLSYGLAFTIGCCGNIAVVVAVKKNYSLRSRTNLFIVNLAIADLLVNILCVPFSLWCNLFDEWIFGEHMCKIVQFCQGLSVTASVYTLIAISLERCIVVACPFSALLSLRKCIVSIWLWSVIINLPWTIVYHVETVVASEGGPPDAKIDYCIEQWPSRQAETIYFAFACLSISYLGPLFAIATCNFMIWRTVINRNAIGEDVLARHRGVLHRTKIKVTKMVSVVVITFFLSWLPLYAILCYAKFSESVELVTSAAAQNFFHITLPIAQFLGAANSSINPILYAFMNKKFRDGFKMLFCKCQLPPCLKNFRQRRRTLSKTSELPLVTTTAAAVIVVSHRIVKNDHRQGDCKISVGSNILRRFTEEQESTTTTTSDIPGHELSSSRDIIVIDSE